ELVNSIYTDETWKKFTWLNDEGKQYEFFQGNVADNTGGNVNKVLVNMNQTQSGAAIVPDLPGVPCNSDIWWQRSCTPNDTTHFLASSSNGNPLDYYSGYASYQLGVLLGFSL
ncbi:MAG: hypothetical protein RR477_09130, partial [Raoultibacter sp.]